MSISYKKRIFTATVDGSVNKTFYASYNGEIIASVTAIDWEKEGAWLNWLYVDEQYRRMGIAKDLISFACSYAAANGKPGIGLSVLPHNIAARDLYIKLGFVMVYESGASYVLTKHLVPIKEAVAS